MNLAPLLVTRNEALFGPRWIIHFPTKKHWRDPSRLEWVRAGLEDLVRVVRETRIRSLALPALGCGNGGLEWTDVRHEIETAVAEIEDVEIMSTNRRSRRDRALDGDRASVSRADSCSELDVEVLIIGSGVKLS